MLEFTGERMVTNEMLGKGIAEHLHRYALALEYSRGKVVLDIASGEGYGSSLLANSANKVIGVDLSPEAVEHARKAYKSEKLEFICGSVLDIPVDDNSIDLVVSFETIEHLEDQETMMSEIHRVLKPGGLLIISSPERDNYKKVDPDNPYHVKELSGEEFNDLLSGSFRNVNMFTQSFHIASIITPIEGKTEGKEYLTGDFNKIVKQHNKEITLYNIALCSDIDLPQNLPGLSVYNGEEMYRDHLFASAGKICDEKLQVLRRTFSYRLGNTLLLPFSWLKRLLNQ